MAGLSVVHAAWRALRWLACVMALSLLAALPGLAMDATAGPDLIRLETATPVGNTVQMAEDLARLLDDGTTRRVMPVVGRGGVQNLADLLSGRGIDMAFVQLDVLDYARTQKLFPALESRISYVARLNYAEFHLLARSDITSIDQLAGQVVDVGPSDGDTAITAARLFGLLKISTLPSNDEPLPAIAKLRRGEIAAVAFVAGKPAPLLRLTDTDGLHLLAVPLTTDVVEAYVPSRLNAADYPGLVAPQAAVDTVAVPTALFVAPPLTGSDQYRKLAAATEIFFTQFPVLLSPGHDGKWAEVNFSSLIPGWQRFPPADDWLRRHPSGADNQGLRTVFMKFLDARAQFSGERQLSPDQKDALFDQFSRGQTGQPGQNN